MDYPWPGNVRELENVLERGAVCARGPVLAVEELPEEVREGGRARQAEDQSGSSRTAPSSASPAGADRQAAERETIARALEENRWNRGETAASLGMDRSTLWRKMKKFGLA
jgi:DNA-binding NtrC family response regulator